MPSFVTGLGKVERDVVRLSLADPRTSLRAPGPLTRIVTLLTGFAPRTGLADPRLEALRRHAVLYRLDGEKLAAAEHLAIAHAGFRDGDVREIQTLVDRHLAIPSRAATPGAPAIVVRLAALAVLAGMAPLVHPATSDIAAAAMIAGLFMVTAISLHRPTHGREAGFRIHPARPLAPTTGTVTVNGERLTLGDGIAATSEARLLFQAEENSEIVLALVA